MDTPLYRSAMFVPGNRPDLMEKAVHYKPDAVVLDLEDSVPNAEKPRARVLVREAIGALSRQGMPVFVRASGPHTGLTSEDIEAAVTPGLTMVVVTKLEHPEQVHKVDAWIEHFEKKAGMAPGSVGISISPETALGVFNIFSLLTASPRVVNLLAGLTARTGDIVSDVGYKWTREGLETRYMESHLLMAARAAGIRFPMCGGGIEVRKPELVREQFECARQTGFRGTFLIHPSQIPMANEIFGLTEQEVAWNKGVIEAMAEAIAKGSAAATYDGMLIDYAHLRAAQVLLAQARSFGMDVGTYPEVG